MTRESLVRKKRNSVVECVVFVLSGSFVLRIGKLVQPRVRYVREEPQRGGSAARYEIQDQCGEAYRVAIFDVGRAETFHRETLDSTSEDREGSSYPSCVRSSALLCYTHLVDIVSFLAV